MDTDKNFSGGINTTPNKSGAAMDRTIEKKKLPLKALTVVGVLLLVAVLIGLYLWDQANARSFVIENSRVVVSPVVRGTFDDFIPIRGRVTPRKTVYLDVIEGGQVEQRLVDDGAIVKAGDLLVTLNNTSLQLDVTRNEAMVTEQLNNMRTIELQLEQNRLQHKRNLVEINYQIKRLMRQIERLSSLDNAGLAIKSQLEDAEDELAYFIERREVTRESQSTDARMQETQLEFLQKSSAQMEGNLSLSRKNLDALNVRAPVDGKLSGLDVEVGQSIQRGGRLGQIDDPESFKLRVEVDEFYLNRVDIGQPARFEHGGKPFTLTVSKIYPQVINGQFELDLLFDDEEPEDIRRGQTLQATLTLGDSTTALIIPNGAFFQDTGGNWMFVVDASGNQAIRRSVRLGRRNSKHIEVLEGLEPDELVITSPYSSFKEMDRLTLTED
ncbi:MAG: efflux RND transporter periplasmic adaptor subunit [Pseudomonadales bacterium]|nr:efflux RND transporter periplasmic adaptor subunit [Pseudomonadales bacterium]